MCTGSFDPNSGADLPTGPNWSSQSGTNWVNQPNLWVDLNSPVASTSSGTTSYIFPIIDGNGIQSLTLESGTGGTSSQFTYSTDGTIPTIEGFATNPSFVGVVYTGTSYSGTRQTTPCQCLSNGFTCLRMAR